MWMNNNGSIYYGAAGKTPEEIRKTFNIPVRMQAVLPLLCIMQTQPLPGGSCRIQYYMMHMLAVVWQK